MGLNIATLALLETLEICLVPWSKHRNLMVIDPTALSISPSYISYGHNIGYNML